VLSVVAQQILSILQALGMELKRFMFEGREINLNKSVGIFITMNPGVLLCSVYVMTHDCVIMYAYDVGDSNIPSLCNVGEGHMHIVVFSVSCVFSEHLAWVQF